MSGFKLLNFDFEGRPQVQVKRNAAKTLPKSFNLTSVGDSWKQIPLDEAVAAVTAEKKYSKNNNQSILWLSPVYEQMILKHLDTLLRYLDSYVILPLLLKKKKKKNQLIFVNYKV